MRARPSVALGVVAVGGSLLLIGLLHPLTAGRVDPIRLTISEYALGEFGWMFDVGVCGLAAGSALVLLALLRVGLLRRRSGAAIALLTWVVGLLVLVAFPKADWSIGPSLSGYVHRYACLAAFVALPLAARAAGWAWRSDPALARFAAGLRVLGGLAYCWLASIVFGMLRYPLTGISWWQFVPLGLTERALALTEIAALLLMAAACLAREGSALRRQLGGSERHNASTSTAHNLGVASRRVQTSDQRRSP